jgi:predicted enzyme related to lactoylglutathione lyase
VSERLRAEIFPADLDRAVDFYLGVLAFELLRDERPRRSPYVYMRRGRVRIGAVAGAATVPDGARRPPIGVELVLEVGDLDAERARIVACGWPLDDDITEQPWGLRDFRLLDPDGYYWRITTP